MPHTGIPRASLLPCLLLGLLLAAPTAHACRVERRAELPVVLADGFPLVRATVGGRAVSFVLDTGAQDLLLTPEAAARLALPRDPAQRTLILGTGGAVVAENAVLPGLSLGGAGPGGVGPGGVGPGGVGLGPRSVPVSPLPGLPAADPPVAGLLGASLLARYDLDLDLPGGRMALHEVRDCPGGVRPFPVPYVMAPLSLTPQGEPFVTVLLDGTPVEALVDTGARGTVLTEAAATRVGLDPAGGGVTHGAEGAGMALRTAVVREMRLGWEVLQGVTVGVAPLRLARGDMLLGADYFAGRRVWVSYSGRRLFVQMPGR